MLRVLVAMCISIACGGCSNVLGVEETRYEAPSRCTLLAERVFFADEVATDIELTLGVLTVAQLHDMARTLTVELDPERGHALASLLDCEGNPIENATLGLDPEPVGATTIAGAEDAVLIGQTTREDGVIGALNVPISETLKLQALPQEIAPTPSSTAEITLAAGELSWIALRPNSSLAGPGDGSAAFQCVGAVPEPMTNEPSVSITLDVVRMEGLLPSGDPLAGVRVRACGLDHSACTLEATTDADGIAELIVPVTNGQGFDGTLELAGILPDCE